MGRSIDPAVFGQRSRVPDSLGVGSGVGGLVGRGVGLRVGAGVGGLVGRGVGSRDGRGVGLRVGKGVGPVTGTSLGFVDASKVGAALGATLGDVDGEIDGSVDGSAGARVVPGGDPGQASKAQDQVPKSVSGVFPPPPVQTQIISGHNEPSLQG